MTETTGPTELQTGGQYRDVPQDSAGRRLKREYQKMFPEVLASGGWDARWQAAAEHGATLEWALHVVNKTGAVTPGRVAMFRAMRVLRLVAVVPVGVIDELFGYGWVLADLYDLMARMGSAGFGETAGRLVGLHEAAPGIGGPDGTLLWHALAAVLSADPAGLTDLQTLRWLQVIGKRKAWGTRVARAFRLASNTLGTLQEWVAGAGPDGWAWAAAGYTLDETKVLLALPAGHPNRPGPDQLAVMAALRQT